MDKGGIMNELAQQLSELTALEMAELMDLVYELVDPEEYNETLLTAGIDVSTWCKRKHPTT